MFRKIAFLVDCLVILTILAGCTNLSTISSTNTSTKILEEKSLPPVFTDMNTLWGKYFSTLIFPPNDHSDLVFGRHPTLATNPEELTLNLIPPAVPDKLIAYKVIRPVVDEAYARNLSQRVGFTGALNFYPADNTYRVYVGDPNNAAPVISIYEDGKISIWYDREKRPSSLPSNEECIDIARNWLTSYDLYPKNIINIDVTPETVAISHGYTTEPPYTYATLVSFSIGLDGYNLFGMGAYFLIGENGKIKEIHINAPDFESYCYVNIQKPSLALDTFNDYLKNPSKFEVDTPECLISFLNRYIQINDMTLKYLAMQSVDASQPVYAQPVYVIKGEGRDKPELSWDSLTIAINAVSN